MFYGTAAGSKQRPFLSLLILASQSTSASHRPWSTLKAAI